MSEREGDFEGLLAKIEGPAASYVDTFLAYRAALVDAEKEGEALTLRQRALVRIAIAVSIPSPELLEARRSAAKELASRDELEEVVCIATALRAGAAVSYGRLAYKYLKDDADSSPASTEIAQIRKDRELMAQFRAASVGDFDRLMAMLGEMHRPGMPLSKLDYELIAIGCATITQCAYCMERHVMTAKTLGVHPSQIAEVIHLAVSDRVEASFLAARSLI